MKNIKDQIEIQTISTSTILSIRITAITKIIFFAIILFTLPLLLSGPQLLVGSIVNFLLIGAVLSLSRKRARPLAFLPSIAAVLHGVIFGPFTIFLVYLMPAIRLGNLVLMYIVNHISQKPFAILTGGIAKAGLLFLIAYILVQNSFLPNVFLDAMGIIQLITAVIGGIAAFGFIKLWKR